jgi:hypothetical protein
VLPLFADEGSTENEAVNRLDMSKFDKETSRCDKQIECNLEYALNPLSDLSTGAEGSTDITVGENEVCASLET